VARVVRAGTLALAASFNTKTSPTNDRLIAAKTADSALTVPVGSCF
jgi:hypothetical protein